MFPLVNFSEINLTPFLFFTGKGGVGKTSTASALAVKLADEGNKVLIVSTDPASNLQDVFNVELNIKIQQIPEVQGLFACNINPEEAARVYREKVVGPYRGKLPDSVIATMEEQLSGACTVEIAAFDEFTNLLANSEIKGTYDYIIFDTAPTGHTLRLLQLPTAWTDFLNESTHGASCLGPLSGLADKKEMYAQSMSALSDPTRTTLFLVARPDISSLTEAARASVELEGTGMKNQNVIINGVLQGMFDEDEVAKTFFEKQQKALSEIPLELRKHPIYEIPLVPFSVTGIDALRKFFVKSTVSSNIQTKKVKEDYPKLSDLINDLDIRDVKIIFTMGKGGVGKTTIASAIAVGLIEKGKRVHLTTTDPAAHLDNIFKENDLINLTVSRIDPKIEVEKYRQEVLSKVSSDIDEQAIAYLKEDLESPCTEEIAIFRAFADVVARSKEEVVVIDTAPTGHTLLLLDAAHSFHKELERSTGEIPKNVKDLLPRLRNSGETEVVIVTLPEPTPVLEARRLQEDLLRAQINPGWWIINQSFYATPTKNPILNGRTTSEKEWIRVVQDDLADKFAVIPWLMEDNINYIQLKKLQG